MKYFLVITMVLLSLMNYAQSTKFSVDELREDFRIFQGSLEDFHPGLYWYRSKKEITHYFDSLKFSISNSTTRVEYLRILSAAVGYMGCGHTWIDLPNRQLNELQLPLKLHFTDTIAICLENNSEDSLAIHTGDQILAINGFGIKFIIGLSKKILPDSDGFTVSGRMFHLNNYFQYVFPKYFEYSSEYEVRILTQAGLEKIVFIKALPFSEIKKNSQSRYDKKNDPRHLTLDFLIDKSAAILQVRHFFDWKEGTEKVRFDDKLQDFFEAIDSAGIENLVMDLRNNGGGRAPWLLYSYFVNKKFIFAKRADFIFSKSSQYYKYQKLHPTMKFLKRRWFNMWFPGPNKVSRIENNRYTLSSLRMIKPLKPSNPYFKGKIYILVNGGTFSAASDFVAMMKSAELATIVGVETGGGLHGNTSMGSTYVTLPNSQMIVSIPLVRHQLNIREDLPLGRGVIPDLKVDQSPDDLLKGVDTQMELLLSLLN